jgi:hypothetical protein
MARDHVRSPSLRRNSGPCARIPEHFFNGLAVPVRVGLQAEYAHHRRAGVENGDRLLNDVAGLDFGAGGNPWDER